MSGECLHFISLENTKKPTVYKMENILLLKQILIDEGNYISGRKTSKIKPYVYVAVKKENSGYKNKQKKT